MTVYAGSNAKITGTFTLNGTNTNPTTSITIYIKKPDGTITSDTPSNASTGVYTYDLALPDAGYYEIKMVGVGTVNKTLYATIDVQPTGFDW